MQNKLGLLTQVQKLQGVKTIVGWPFRFPEALNNSHTLIRLLINNRGDYPPW